MVTVFSQMENNDSPQYRYDKTAVESVIKFADGTFNFFPYSVYRRKTNIRHTDEQVGEEHKEENKSLQSEEIPELEYDLKLGITVFIGKDECEITTITADRVEFFDGAEEVENEDKDFNVPTRDDDRDER